MLNKYYLLLLAVCMGQGLLAQSAGLDALLAEAKAYWPQLKQRQSETAAARAGWEVAKGSALPQVTLESSYSLAAGGRSIDLPIGDLLNPVYTTLNQITQTNAFPQLDNVNEQFLPNNFYDVHLRMRYPVYQPEVKTGQLIRSEQVEIAQLQEAVTLHDLERDVRMAYCQWQQATTGRRIVEEAQALMKEALRTTQSLIANGAGLPVARYRLESELAQLNAQWTEADMQVANALAVINYYRGQPLDSPLPAETMPVLPTALPGSVEGRPELAQLRTAVRISDHQLALEERFYQPRVGLQVDAGSQDFNFQWNPYAMAGISLNMPLYDGRQHRFRVEQLQANKLALEAQTLQTEQSLALRADTRWRQYQASLATLEAYEQAITAATKAYQDTERLYREGSANYLTLLDARTSLTIVQQQQNIAFHEAWKYYIELLRDYAK